ncbi:MAG: glycosyltransferase family 4 protein, partial [Acidobacteria bacterium]|nr:glycosyltransferase family 4 protein [Acidobacteriota bacterium]
RASGSGIVPAARMRVLHIAPTFFDAASVIGGAERFTWELARAMAHTADVTLLTFGPRAFAHERDGVQVQCLKHWGGIGHSLMPDPVRWSFVRALRAADIVHCYQVDVMSTNAGVLGARALGRPVFVTDLGGGYARMPSRWLPIMRLATAYLLISDYSRQLWLQRPRFRRPDHLDVIYGGVDTDHFSPGGAKDPSMVVFVGRLVAHKGVEHLIDAIGAGQRLHVVGRPYDQAYLAFLRDKARGKNVVFEHDVDDAGLVERYRRAAVSVLPSVATNYRGVVTGHAELFGLAAAEAMACGTATIVTNTASLPEVVADQETGFVVPPGDAGALARRIGQLCGNPGLAAMMGTAARRRIIGQFTWDATARRCLAAYARAINPGAAV